MSVDVEWHLESVVTVEDRDRVVSLLQGHLQRGDSLVALKLEVLARDTSRDINLRCRALETLTGVPGSLWSERVRSLVGDLCMDSDYRVQLSAIAAATDLPKTDRDSLVCRVTQCGMNGSNRIALAARAFVLAG